MKTVSLELGRQKPKYAGIAQEQYEGRQKAQQRKRLLDEIEELVLGGCTRRVAIKFLDISERTYDYDKKADKTRGIVGLEERSKRPHDVRKPT